MSLQATKLHFLHITEASKKSKGSNYCANTAANDTQANKLFWWKVSTGKREEGKTLNEWDDASTKTKSEKESVSLFVRFWCQASPHYVVR